MNETSTAVAIETPQPDAEQASRPRLMPVVDEGEFSALLDSNRFAQIQRVAKLFSESDLVPQVFQGKPANCAVALQMAFRMRVDPMMLMQNMYIVHGKPGIEAKLAIALINQRGPFEGPVQWRADGSGDARTWTAFAKHKATGQMCEAVVTWAMVKAEGWLDKSGSKWKTMPDMMGRYRSATFLGRLYCPEVLLGLPTNDELVDVSGIQTVVTGERVVDLMPRAASAAAPQEPRADVIEATDTTTGEITAAQPQQGTLVDPEPQTDAAAMKPASEAQRRMLIEMSKKKGLSVAQLDELLIERFATGVDELPLSCVSKATELIGGLKAA